MSKPSFSNIDLWLFELAEGNLSAEQKAQLELFLLQHPELDVDRDMWEMARVQADPVTYPHAEDTIRRRPTAMYAAMGSTLFILLTFVGCYNYFGLDAVEGVHGKKRLAGTGTSEQVQLEDQIKELKEDIRSLENENIRLANTIDELKNGGNEVSVSSTSSTYHRSVSRNNYRSSSVNNTLTASSAVGASSYSSAPVRSTISPSIIASNPAGVSSTSYEDLIEERNASSTVVNNRDIRTYEPRTIEYDWFTGRGYFADKYSPGAKKYKKEDHRTSFKKRLNKLGRAIQRAMDNPIAMKNKRDPHYHVPGMLPQDINFGANGTLLTTRVQAMSRIQWLGTENEQMMNQIAFDGYSRSIKGGFGIQLNHSMFGAGGIHVGDVALTYSPKFSIGKVVSVEPAFRFKMGNKLLNHNAMNGVTAVEVDRGNVYDYYSDGTNPLGTNLWYKDLGAGLMVNAEWFFAGIQVDNMLRHRDNIYSFNIDEPRRAALHTVATVGTWFESIDKRRSLSTYVVYQKEENLNEAWVGFNGRLGKFMLGGAVSSNLEPAASIGLKFDRFAINYNADYTKSAMTNQHALSHQISIRFLGKQTRSGKRLLNH
jgi:hypothetical protein